MIRACPLRDEILGGLLAVVNYEGRLVPRPGRERVDPKSSSAWGKVAGVLQDGLECVAFAFSDDSERHFHGARRKRPRRKIRTV